MVSHTGHSHWSASHTHTQTMQTHTQTHHYTTTHVCHLVEAFSHVAFTAQKVSGHRHPPLPITRYSFKQPREVEQCGVNYIAWHVTRL